ncbi:MAG: amidohydrolase family protein [Candidatus Alcyoniella australis]|nr:amidohydrolase family protein [Candidatus Alcyoniella australis]
MSVAGIDDRLLRAPARRPIVDVHTHLFPERLFRAIRQWFDNVGWRIDYPYRTTEVLDLLRGWGVEENWALIYAHKPGLAAQLNAWMGNVQQQHAGVRGFATLHPDDPQPELILQRALDEYRLCGVKIHAEVQQIRVDDQRLDRAFDLLQERGLPCVLHCGDAPYPEPPPILRWELVARRLERHPRLRAVIAHLGANQTTHYLELMQRYPGLYLDVSFTRFPGSPGLTDIDPSILEPVCDRLLFGSDFPNITFGYADQVDCWLELDWVREHADDLFVNNARRLLPPSAASYNLEE